MRFLIAGECRESKRYADGYSRNQLLSEIAHDPRILYVGYRSDIENIYCSADIVTVPSRWQEPFGLINIEAGAARRPVVASRVGGIPEVIRDGENGLLFDPDHPASFAAAIRQLVEDKALRLRMGARARAVVEEEFTTKPIHALEALYEELTGR